jgi:chromosome partitioning protein
MSVVVAFVSKKGGVGKSTLARALTAVLVRRGLQAILADLDTEQQTSIRWQRLREKNGIIPPLTVTPFETFDAAIIGKQEADVVVLDAPSHAPQLTHDIAQIAHLLVQPCGAGFDDLQPAVDLFYQLEALGIDKSRLWVALSRVLDADEEAAARAYIEAAMINVLPGVITERALYREAHNQGLAFIESPGEDLSAPAAVTLSALLTWIVQQLDPRERLRLVESPPAL